MKPAFKIIAMPLTILFLSNITVLRAEEAQDDTAPDSSHYDTTLNQHAGVTIGHGVDLSQFTKAEMRKIGIPDFLLAKIPDVLFAPSPGTKGLQGTKAQQWLDKHPLSLSRYEAEFLSAKVYDYKANHIINTYDNLYGSGSFSVLSRGAKTVLVDLGFARGIDYLGTSEGRKLSDLIHKNELRQAADYILQMDPTDEKRGFYPERYRDDAQEIFVK